METNTRIMGVISRMLPFTERLGKTRPATIKADAMAGLTVALVLIPHYAQLAALPACYGLYASFLPPMVAALFGSSHMEEQIRDRRKSKRQLKHIIIVANGINDIDATGYGSGADEAQCMQLGAFGYLQKLVDIEKLSEMLKLAHQKNKSR